MAKQGSNKARNQLRGGGRINAKWFDKNKAKRRKATKIAKQTKKRNRK